MNAGLTELIRKVRVLWRYYTLMPKLMAGTVASVSPLTVYLDGDLDDDDNPIATPAVSMTGTLTLGAAVFCAEKDNRITVIASS
ncbi:hypothetical protein [Microbacterium esteraromaticum]|uniref:hypothetical protein n=1 Tax=Microbacterium esteraromaticum TaxID=57043 RepID=UPI0019D32327|nr:hypothetical protein [Microbacterium esteraromaticum]MBN7792439.1 hypothetical protein [Microbacterium esteraromaticum]